MIRSNSLRSLILLALLPGLVLSGCVTHNTAMKVTGQPMTKDLEKQVLQETGISGAFIGAATGAAAAYATAYGVAKLQGMSHDDAHKTATRAAAIGAVGGVIIGYEKGEQEGEKVVAKAMGRDKLSSLLTGARAYNKDAAAFNDSLRSKIAVANKDPDVRSRKASYASLKSQAISKSKSEDSRIAERQKALGNDAWTSSEKSVYRSELAKLQQEREELQTSINRLEAAEKSVRM